jgi:hypothetical protein
MNNFDSTREVEVQGARVKARRSKTRTGCRTCKYVLVGCLDNYSKPSIDVSSHRTRRLKCDETRPACLRCTSTGRFCDGYGPLAIASLPFDIPGSDAERRSYHYFRLQTSSAILGLQDSKYWTTSLLQLSYTQPAIKHVLIAMASVHEALVGPICPRPAIALQL